MECVFCKQILSTKSALNTHQSKAKYCLKLQGKKNKTGDFICVHCNKDFFNNNRHKSHILICKENNSFKQELDDTKLENNNLNIEIITLKKENEILKIELEKFRSDYKEKAHNILHEDYKELSITAVKRPTTSTKNIQINNYIKNMMPLLDKDIESNIDMLTLEHHVKGAEGYAEYALEFPFKDKIVCVDIARNKIKYKNEVGDIVEDIGFKKIMTRLCGALKDRSFNLSQEHYEKLSDTFTENEMDDFNFMETAMAITKYANGRESDFCKDIIKMISRGSSL
jgi:hypothetical protein